MVISIAHKHIKGYSMIELLIALFVASLMLVGFGVTTQSIRAKDKQIVEANRADYSQYWPTANNKA